MATMNVPVAVVTGGTRGIGLAIAKRLARTGVRVVIAARNPDALIYAAKQVSSAGTACETVIADVGSEKDALRLIETAAARCGRIDVLVNNAGVAPMGTLETFSTADFNAIMHVNMAGVFYTTRATWPIMKRQGGGTIVNISSVAAVDPFPGFAAYGASKAWLNLFTQAAAAEGKAAGIRVFAVAPGAVDTDMLRGAFPDYPRENTLDPDDVAGIVEAVCQPHFVGVSGQAIYVRK